MGGRGGDPQRTIPSRGCSLEGDHWALVPAPPYSYQPKPETKNHRMNQNKSLKEKKRRSGREEADSPPEAGPVPCPGAPPSCTYAAGAPGPEQVPTAGRAAGPDSLCGRSPGSELELPTGGRAGAAPAHARSRARARRPAPGFRGDAGPAREGRGGRPGEGRRSEVVAGGREGRETKGEGREGSSCDGEENCGSWGRAPKRKRQVLPLRPFPRSQGAQLKFSALCSPRPCKAPTGSRSQRPRRAGLPVAPGIKHQQAW